MNTKKNKKVISSIIAASIAFTSIPALPVNADTYDSSDYTVSIMSSGRSAIVNTTSKNLNLRQYASTSSKIIASMPKGASIIVYGNPTNGFYKVDYNGTIGYASSQYIKITGNSNISVTSGRSAIINTSSKNLNLRQYASTDSKIIASMPKGASVTVYGNPTNGFYKVYYNGTIGYASSQYIKIVGDPNTYSNGYDSKVNAFLNDSRWKNGTSWGARGPKLSSYSCSGCCAYAADFVKYVFGKNSPRDGSAFYSPSVIRAGDIIRFVNSQHWIVVLSRNGNSLRVAEGNWGSKVVVSNGTYTIQNGQVYRNGKKFRTFDVGYHFQ